MGWSHWRGGICPGTRLCQCHWIRLVVLAVLQTGLVAATTFYASPHGSDGGSGSLAAPFLTVQRCVDAAHLPGDACLLRAGTYREQVRLRHSSRGPSESAPVTLSSFPGERAVLSALDVVHTRAAWQRVRELGDGAVVYEAPVDVEYSALFVDGRLQMSGRWPHVRLEDSWDRARTFRLSGSRSTLVHNSTPPAALLDVEGAPEGVDWVGGLVCLSVGYQSKCSPVLGAEAPNLLRIGAGICDVCTGARGWKSREYFLSGPPAAIGVAGEWSQRNGIITVALPPGKAPSDVVIEGRVRHVAAFFSGTPRPEVPKEYLTSLGQSLQYFVLSNLSVVGGGGVPFNVLQFAGSLPVD